MPRKVTIICASFPPETGAAPGRMAHLASLLQSNGMQVRIITALPNYPKGRIFEGYRGRLWHKEQINGLEVYRSWLIPSNKKKAWHRALSMSSYIFMLLALGFPRLIRNRPDLVILSSPPFATGFFGSLIARWSGTKILLNISDLYPLSLSELNFLRGGWLYRTLTRMEGNMYRRADALCGQSEEILAHVARQVPATPLFLYRNLAATAAGAARPRSSGRRKIVYAGLLGIAQGVFDICRAIDFAAAGTELHIYGQGNETENIKTLIREQPDRGICYHGSVPAAEIPDLMQQYHIMLIPLRTGIAGAVPSKIFNSMANGLPVLFSGGGEAARIIRDSGTGLVNAPGDYQGLLHNLQQFLAMSDEAYEQLRSNCLTAINGPFNRAKQDQAFLAFLQTHFPEA